MFKPTPHPVLRLPTAAQAMAMGAVEFDRLFGPGGAREKAIAEEKFDPLQHGWEPPIWRVCDCLLGFPWVPLDEAERVRRNLGFTKPIDILLINGGQRGAKTTYGIKRGMKTLVRKPGANAWFFHSNLKMSIKWHMEIVHQFMPPHLRKKIKSDTTYIAYKKQTGFSDEKFIMDNLSTGEFRTYEQDASTIEGANLDYIFCDELVPAEFVRTLQLRIAERQGKMVIGFTPVDGYTETVREFQDGAEVMRESIAYLCPRDGGPPDVARALGLDDAELAELMAAEESAARGKPRASWAPASEPERCEEWSREASAPSPDSRREFERVPRVMKCADPEGKRAVVFFHTADNPYGNPRSVWSTIARGTREFIKERFYGIAHKTLSARFPKFHLKVHVVPPEEIPKEGSNYLVVDPAGGRNWFMLWVRATPAAHYVYREWPGAYYIPGVGVPGPWAIPDGKRPDGARGPAQKEFGWGPAKYKREIARLEGWTDYQEAQPPDKAFEEWVRPWHAGNGARERIVERFMDCRFLSSPSSRPFGDKVDFRETEGDKRLRELDMLGISFSPAPGDELQDGIRDINDALDYDETRPVGPFNRPRLFVSAECRNTIYSLQTWTGLDGYRTTQDGEGISQRGASKDPIDCVRYYLRAEVGYMEHVGGGQIRKPWGMK